MDLSIKTISKEGFCKIECTEERHSAKDENVYKAAMKGGKMGFDDL